MRYPSKEDMVACAAGINKAIDLAVQCRRVYDDEDVPVELRKACSNAVMGLSELKTQVAIELGGIILREHEGEKNKEAGNQ